MNSKNIDLIKQSLSAAESSIKLAKQLLSELNSSQGEKVDQKLNPVDLPGISGVFDGEKMISESGESYPVPANYASKSMLVVGDTLKLVEEGKNKEKRFKQIEHVKRHKSTGILTKKDGKWRVVTPEGSYKVLGAAVEHFGADIGTEVTLHLPANNLTVAYGAIEAVKRPETEKEKPIVSEEINTENKTQPVITPEVKKEIIKKEVKTEVKVAKPLVKPKEVEKKVPVVEKEQEELKKESQVIPVTKPEVQNKVEEVKPVVSKIEPDISAPKVELPPTTVSSNVPLEVAPEEEELT